MKKFLCICLCGILAASMVSGCSKQEGSAGKSSSTVKLGEYKGITYTPMSTEVTDEDVDAEVQALLDAHPTMTSVDRAAALGDTVNIDYVGKLDGEAFDGGSASGTDLELGSGMFIDGFEDGLVGASKGDQLDLNLTFPDPYTNNPDLAGKEVVFEVTVNDVKESNPAELNEDFLASYTEYTTVDEFMAGTRQQLEDYAKSQAESQMQYDIFTKVMDNSEINVSDEDVQAYYEELYDTYKSQAEAFGIELETMISYYGMDLATFEAQLKSQAEAATKQDAVAREIASKEGITVEDADREAMAEDFGYESVDAMIEDGGADMVDSYILMEKVLDLLVANAVAE